ncbi:hypothetical protein CEXT_384821 [Caerostris extrusa]|uniref:C2H2-type domain-containing protein n=1 Tax=Caerostris extrusa TaxID=172846 RepID=A0AAV4RSF1_CAEEX|nr:hypothetical protein CEXT_384821 [Caerostris extrusa]
MSKEKKDISDIKNAPQQHENPDCNRSFLEFVNDAGVRLYKCSICSREFCKKQQIMRHIELHKDVRVVYSCNLCSSQFTRKDSLQQHERLQHNIMSKKCYKVFPFK